MTTGPPNDSATQGFLDRAYPRMIRFSLALAGIGAAAAFAVWGMAATIGFALGSIAAILNFVWLHRAAEALIGRMLSDQNTGSRFRITLGFLGRYSLVGLIAYAIFKSSAQAFGAFLAALPLPIVAAMCEAAYEAFLNVKDPDSANT
jgi:ATP synthase I chain